MVEVGHQRVEVEVQPVAGEDRETAWSPAMTKLVDDSTRRILRAGATLQHGDEFGQRVDHDPQPEHVRALPQARAEFVEQELRELEVAQPAVVQCRTVLTGPAEPGGKRILTMPKDQCRRNGRELCGICRRTSAKRTDAVLRRSRVCHDGG